MKKKKKLVKRKITKRSGSRYPGLDPSVNLKIRQELLDQDYINKLSDKDKQWLNDFNMEYIQANFDHEGKRLHKKKMRTRKVKSTGKRRSYDVGKKSVQDANNARNRDAFSITKANFILEQENKTNLTDNSLTRSTKPNEMEDALIAMIDYINEKKNT